MYGKGKGLVPPYTSPKKEEYEAMLLRSVWKDKLLKFKATTN